VSKDGISVTTSELARLFDTTSKAIADLGKRGIIVSGEKRGRWQLQPSVSAYIRHLREEADAQAARALQANAQATLSEAKARQLSGEIVEVETVETFWRAKLKAFRNRVLAIPSRVNYLSVRQRVNLTQELRACLDELSDDVE
jgi:phage terminase Nu1 subunit (DNA packaging protein)